MDKLITYRYEGSATLGEGTIPDFSDTGKEIGEWIPDTRLRAIVDAWNFYKLEIVEVGGIRDVRYPFSLVADAIEDAITEEKR